MAYLSFWVQKMADSDKPLTSRGRINYGSIIGPEKKNAKPRQLRKNSDIPSSTSRSTQTSVLKREDRKQFIKISKQNS
jgi:hypothetical protein